MTETVKKSESVAVESVVSAVTPGGSVLSESTAVSEMSEVSGGMSRRKFLKILGSSAAVGAVGCAKEHDQNIYPRVKSEDGQIPGVPVWYSSTCTECSAGCGIQVKTVDGRAIKVEGLKDSPINKGGLCALGQASLQSLYDPDRIRQPLKRDLDGSLKPISWEDAYAKVVEVLSDKSDASLSNMFISGEMTGALEELVADFSQAAGVTHVTYDITQPVAHAKACQAVYGGDFGIPTYRFEKAEVIVNFGADFLETWVSPVEFARGWAANRKAEHPSRFFHIEPRLSLTGANADSWLKCKPGSEVHVALALLSELVNGASGEKLAKDLRQKISAFAAQSSVEKAVVESGIERTKILLMVDALKNARGSLVLSGGVSTASDQGYFLSVVTSLINVVLGNVGRTVDTSRLRKPKSSAGALVDAITKLNSGKGRVLFIHGTNPAFSAPSSLGFGFAARKAVLVVAISSHLDESAKLADIILPPHTGLESWADSRVVPGVYSLVQPAMAPVFDTKNFGDILLDIAAQSGVKLARLAQASDGAAEGEAKVAGFQAYLKASWKELQARLGVQGSFDDFWRSSLEKGGYYVGGSSLFASPPAISAASPVFQEKMIGLAVSDSGLKDESEASAGHGGSNVHGHSGTHGHGGAHGHGDSKDTELQVYPYFSIKTFDGRSANRPWMQELPDPITQIVWDSWVEINPATAKKKGVKQGDLVTLRNKYGEVNVPAYLTEHVVEGILAVPVGQGHQEYGRFARAVGGGNVLSLLPPRVASDGLGISLLGSGVILKPAQSKHTLVVTSGSDSQLDRGLARTKYVGNVPPKDDHEGGHGLHHEAPFGFGQHDKHRAINTQENGPKQMYLQREHPLYEWGMSVDLAACTGCSACVVACYAENNIPVVGKELCNQGREMSWLRIERYYDESPDQELTVSFLPMMCQHCHNAPCEPVCPVFATYHNEEGMNVMVYNRCVGTRYCSNNCSYKVRRFNWLTLDWPEPLNWQLNPDVTRRTTGVMEKCTFCIQRIIEAKDHAKDEGRLVQDGEVQPACVQSCPTQALVFGDLNDPNSKVRALQKDDRAYRVLSSHINTQPAVSYLEDVKVRV